MCYICLGMGFYLVINDKDIATFTALVATILGIYTAGNVTESTAVLKHSGEKTDEG